MGVEVLVDGRLNMGIKKQRGRKFVFRDEENLKMRFIEAELREGRQRVEKKLVVWSFRVLEISGVRGIRIFRWVRIGSVSQGWFEYGR